MRAFLRAKTSNLRQEKDTFHPHHQPNYRFISPLFPFSFYSFSSVSRDSPLILKTLEVATSSLRLFLEIFQRIRDFRKRRDVENGRKRRRRSCWSTMVMKTEPMFYFYFYTIFLMFIFPANFRYKLKFQEKNLNFRPNLEFQKFLVKP